MPNKVDYRTFSQRVKNKYPEYINMGDLELAQMWVSQNPQYGEFVMFDRQPVKKKDQAAPSLGEQGGLQYASTGDPIADKAQTQSALKSYSQKKDKSEEIGFWENIGNNILNGSSRMWNDFTQTGYEFGMISRGVPIAGAQALSKTARPFYENYKTKTRQEMGLLEESAASFANSIPLMVGSIGLGGAAGAGVRVAGTLPMFISGFQESGREAEELGITDPLDRLTFQTIGGTIEGASELIMPDASLIRPLRKRVLNDLVRIGGKGLSRADAGRYVAEFTEKVAKEVGEEYAVEIGNVLRNASFAAAGYDKAAPEMKSARDYAVMTLSAALGAGTFAGVGTGFDAATAKSTAIKKAAEDPEAAAQAAADLVDAGKLTQEQADAFLAKVASVNRAVGKMPKDVDPDVAVNTADLLNEKVDLEESVRALEEEKNNVDPSFHQGIDDQIAQITGRINELTQQITEFQTPTITLDVERIDQAAPEATQMAPAEVSPEVGMEMPQEDQGVLQVINSVVQPISSDIEARMNNAEEIPMSEIEAVVDALIDAQQSVRSQEGARTRQTQGGFVTEFGALSEDQKRNFDTLIEQQINKLLNYEFATITTTEQAGEKTKTAGLVATPREGRPLPESVVSRDRFDGAGVRIGGRGAGRITVKRLPGFGGRSVYGVSFGNRKGVAPVEDLEFDNLEFVAPEILADGSFNARIKDSQSGLEFTITDPELSIDLAIAAQLKEAGRKEFPQPAFLEAVREVTQGQPTQVTTFPNLGRTGTTPAAVGVEPQTEQDVRQETNAPQEGRGQGEDAAPVPQEEGRQEGQVTPLDVAQEGETPPATKRVRKTEQQKADEGRAALDKLKETIRTLRAKPGGGANIDLTFGVVPISKAVWNTALDTAILAIDAGQSIAQVIKDASDYISSKIDGDWGKGKFESYMNDQFAAVAGKGVKQKLNLSSNPTLNTFLNELNQIEGIERSPIDPSELIYGETAAITLRPGDNENEIDISSIRSLDKGKGLGKKAMNDINSVADKLGITLKLNAKPFGTTGLSKADLIKFYQKAGFRADLTEYGGEFASEEEMISYVNEVDGESLPMIRLPNITETEIDVKDVSVKKNEDNDHIVSFKGVEVGKMFYDRSIGSWINSDFDRSNEKPYSVKWVYGDILGDTKDEAISELVNRFNKGLGPKVEKPTTQPDVLKDVESTTKALEGLASDKFRLESGEETPTAINVDYGDISWPQSGLSSFNEGSDGKTYVTDKNGDIYQVSKTKLSANKTFLVTIKNTNGEEVGSFEFKRNSDGSFSSEESYTSKKGVGIATIAYDIASKDGEVIKPSKKLKKDGVRFWAKSISNAYHKAKADGSNPKLVQAVEDLLGQTAPEAKPAKTISEQRKEFRETAKKYFEGMKKMGIAFDPERNSKEDIAFLKALAKYIKLELDAGMVTFKGFMEKTANLVEDFKEASVVKAAKDVWAKEVVKAYPKLYAKYSAAKRKELEKEIKDITKTMIRRIMDMTDPKIVNLKSQLKTEKRRLSKEAAAQLAAIRNAYDAKTMMAMEPEDLMELMRLTEGIYKEGRSEIKALNESLDEAAQIQGEEMLAAIASKDKRLEKLDSKEAASKMLAKKAGVVVAVKGDDRVIMKEEKDLEALGGEGYTFLFLNTTSDKFVDRGFLDSVVSFFSGKLRTINENARDLRTALELIKSRSKESQDFINGLVAKMNKASVTKARKSEEWSSILKRLRSDLFGPDIKFGYTNWMNAIAKVNGKPLKLINGRGVSIGSINNGKIVSLYRQIMDPTNLVKTDGVRKIDLSDESIQSIIDYMNLPGNLPGKEFALSLTNFFIRVAKDTKVVLENNGYNSTKLDEKRYNKEDFEGDDFIAKVMDQLAETRSEGFIPYTPIQATESPDNSQGVEINEDDLLDSGDLQKNFSVISNNMITRRPGGVIVPTDIRQTLNAYTAGMANMNAKLPILRETQSVFSKRNLTAMNNAFAPQFTENLKANYISFMTDRVTPVSSSKTTAAIKTWLMTSTAIPMFLNFKSAVLQLSSLPNFLVSYDSSRYIDASKKVFGDWALFKRIFFEIIDLPTVRQRFGGRFSPDSRIISEEVGRYGKVAIKIPFTNISISAKELLSKGYIFSSIGDVISIAIGAAPIYYDISETNKKKYIADGMSVSEAEEKATQDAEERLFEIIQETQQSSEAMYLSEFQKQSITRIFSSFATATMQYYRKARRAAARMKNKEGDQLQNAYEILHYTAVNAAMFQFFSSMFVDWLSGPGEDELEEMSREERMDFVRYMEDVMATVAQGTGGMGVALQAIILGLKESQKSGKPEKIVESALRTVPAVRMKYDAAVNTIREWKRGDYVRSLTKGAELANIPADRIRSLGLQVSDALTENLEAQERIARLIGFRTESWMREKKEGEIWNGVQSTIDKSTPAERQRAISNTKSAYRDLFQLYGKRYAEATTEAERARVDSIASKELLNVYNHRQGGPEFTKELQKLFNQSLEFNSLPKDMQKLKNMESNRKIGDIVEEVLSLEKKSEQKAMEYWSSLVNNGIISKNEIERIREEYNTRKGLQ